MTPKAPQLHCTVYRGSVAAATANSSINIISSTGDVVQNNQYFPRDNCRLLYAAAFGTDLSAPRLTTPSLLRICPQYFAQYNVTAPFGTDFNLNDYLDNPIQLAAEEGLDVQCGNTNVGAQTMTVVLGLMFGSAVPPRGDRRTLRATSATTVTANTWSNCPLTFADRIPAGLYEVVGVRAFGTTMYAARLAMPGGYYRPGVPTFQTLGQRPPDNFRFTEYGGYGQFEQSVLPSLEVLCTAADTAQTTLIDVVKVA